MKARDEFMLASLKAPADPAPHLALARVYVYSLPNPGRAMEEFAAAERLGAVLGRREIEQQGDAYRIWSQQELAQDWRQAARDAEVARAFYQRIPGFDEADQHLREFAADSCAGSAQGSGAEVLPMAVVERGDGVRERAALRGEGAGVFPMGVTGTAAVARGGQQIADALQWGAIARRYYRWR